MRQRLLWVCIGLIVGLIGPGYAPLSKSLILRGVAYVNPGSLDYCSPLGRHVAEKIESANDWQLGEHEAIRHKASNLLISPAGQVFVGDTDVAPRLTTYDKDVIHQRLVVLHAQFREQEDARLVRQLDLEQKLKIDSKLAANLAGVGQAPGK